MEKKNEQIKIATFNFRDIDWNSGSSFYNRVVKVSVCKLLARYSAVVNMQLLLYLIDWAPL